MRGANANPGQCVNGWGGGGGVCAKPESLPREQAAHVGQA